VSLGLKMLYPSDDMFPWGEKYKSLEEGAATPRKTTASIQKKRLNLPTEATRIRLPVYKSKDTTSAKEYASLQASMPLAAVGAADGADGTGGTC
jgi:hypothetical protein